jgi:hypothetical protein
MARTAPAGPFRPEECQDLRAIGQAPGREVDQAGEVVLPRRAAAHQGRSRASRRRPSRVVPRTVKVPSKSTTSGGAS